MIWIIASIFYAYQYVIRVMPNIMIGDIMQQFNIDAATFGQFSGVYYIGYSLMHLPIGIMLDRYGPRKIMALSMLLIVVGLSPLVLTRFWIYPIVGRFLIGIGSSTAILGLFKIIRMTFSEKRFARMLSISVTIGLLGAIYGGGPVNYLCNIYGYHVVVYLMGAIGLVLAGVTYILIPNTSEITKEAILSNIKKVLLNPKVLPACLCAGLMVGPLEGFADVWGTVFLTYVYGLDTSLAATLPSMIFIGMCFGSPLLNLIAEKVGNYFITIIGSGLLMAFGFTLLMITSLSPLFLSICFIIIGACCAYQILAIYKISTYVRAENAGLTTAVANMTIMLFGYLFHTAMGSVIQIYGGASDAKALFYGISIIPIGLFLGTCGFIILYIRERTA